MAIKPKKVISSRGEGGVGGAARGGGTGGSVKVVKEPFQKARNSAETINVNARKSGLMARLREQEVKQSKPAKVVKINSAPAKSPDAAKAANAKALKAANKGKKK